MLIELVEACVKHVLWTQSFELQVLLPPQICFFAVPRLSQFNRKMSAIFRCRRVLSLTQDTKLPSAEVANLNIVVRCLVALQAFVGEGVCSHVALYLLPIPVLCSSKSLSTAVHMVA